MIRAVFSSLAFVLLAALPLRAEVDIQEVTSPGGIHAWLVESHEVPFVSLEIRFQGGASLDAPGKRGAINLMTGLLEEGAGEMDARAFARERDALAASYRF
ncbi:insulinase family protein, partial [Rhodovulum sulfidophilum]|nr:insulinase family protein [Rhodovulum sulfidophilum]